MKIESIELNWFRGASEQAVLKANGKSVVVYGENGSGKSSFVDSFEYMLTNGRIEHLRFEYADRRGQRNCVRNTETPGDVDARAVIRFVDNTQSSVTIPSSGRISFQSVPDDLITSFNEWKRQSHILRQGEIAEFVNETKSNKYSTLSPLIGLQKFEDIFENMKKLERHIRTEANYRGLTSERDRLKEELTRKVGTYEEEEVIKTLQKKIKKYGISYDSDISSTSAKALEVVQGHISEYEPEFQRYFKLDNLNNINLPNQISEFRDMVEDAEKQISEYIEQKINILERSDQYFAWEELEGEIQCPVCGTIVNKDTLVEHVKQELEALHELREISHMTRDKKREITRTFEQFKNQIRDEELQNWFQSPENEQLNKNAKIILEINLPDEISPWELNQLDEIIGLIIKIKNFIKNILTAEPPSMRGLQTDYQFFITAPLIFDYQQYEHKITIVNRLCNSIGKTQENIRKKIVEITTRTLEIISSDMQSLWKILHDDDPIEEIMLEKSKATDTGIDITLKFHGKNQLSPSLTLSEGHRNSLGLCVFLAMAKQEPQNHPIFLDDIVSSLDRDHRGFVVDVLKSHLEERQVLLFTHDREWYDELKRRLDRRLWTFYHLKKWESPTGGIQVSPTHFTFDQARAFLPNETNAAGNACRAIMDDELARKCERLEVTLPFVRGPNNDHRTWYDFFEGLLSQGRTKFRINNGSWNTHQKALDTWQEARDLLVTWGNRSSHGGSLTEEEADRMIDICSQSIDYFNCPECGKPVWYLKRENVHLRCDCDKIRWKL